MAENGNAIFFLCPCCKQYCAHVSVSFSEWWAKGKSSTASKIGATIMGKMSDLTVRAMQIPWKCSNCGYVYIRWLSGGTVYE